MSDDDDFYSVLTLDILDLDESIVDEKIERLIMKSDLTLKQLRVLLIFVKYKSAISVQEETGCDNDSVINFTLQTLTRFDDSTDDKFDVLLEILSVSFRLNKDNFSALMEHSFQQLISNVKVQNLNEVEAHKSVVYLKIINRLAVICSDNEIKPNGRFIKAEVIELLKHSQNEAVNNYLYFYVVPNLIKCFEESSILNFIYDRAIENINAENLLALCTLSDFYFPDSLNSVGIKIQSSVVKELTFWKFIQTGIFNSNAAVKKYSIFLTKRALDFIVKNEKYVCVYEDKKSAPYLFYVKEEKVHFEKLWFDFFIVIETLDEKQFHLVEPALKLLKNIDMPHPSWYYGLLKLILEHENNQILIKGLEIIFEIEVLEEYRSMFPFKELLKALNKIFLYENFFDVDNALKKQLLKFFGSNVNCSALIESSISTLSPIPRYFISYILRNISEKKDLAKMNKDILSLFFGHSGYTSNNHLIEYGTKSNILYILLNNSMPSSWNIECLLTMISISEDTLYRGTTQWNDLTRVFITYKNSEFHGQAIKIIYDVETQKKFSISAIVKIILMMVDADLIDSETFIKFIETQLNALKQSGNRTYADMNDFEKEYIFIVNCIKNLEKLEREDLTINKKLHRAFYECLIENCDSIIGCIFKFFQSERTLQLILQYTDGLETLLNCKEINMNMFLGLESEIFKYFDENSKNYALIALSKMSRFLVGSDLFSVSDKLKYITRYRNCFNEYLFIENENHRGTLANVLYKAKCDIDTSYYSILDSESWTDGAVTELNDLILELLEKSGDLLSTVKLSKHLIPKMSSKKRWNDVNFVLKRTWREILQIRKNERFKDCLKIFIENIFVDHLITNQEYQDLCFLYTTEILSLSESTPIALYLLITHVDENLNNYEAPFVIKLIGEAIVYGSVSRKDQKIEMEVSKYICMNCVPYRRSIISDWIVSPVEKIKSITQSILMKQSRNNLKYILIDLKDGISSMCKSKHRYHTNSLNHRIIFRALQSFLMINKLYPDIVMKDDSEIVIWSVEILTRQPHHASVRFLYEWLISLIILSSKMKLSDASESWELSKLPKVSYFNILYFVSKHQLLIREDLNALENFDFAVRTYLPFTMGQLFNTRLHSQYLINRLYDLVRDPERKEKYTSFNDIIVQCLNEHADEKNVQSIRENFHLNHFDVVDNLNFEDLFCNVPRLTGVSEDERLSYEDAIELDNKLSVNYKKTSVHKSNKFQLVNLKPFNAEIKSSSEAENSVFTIDAIQKKFVPWQNMTSELGLSINKEADDENCLIVVASLIDRIPNLGGLSRTCEVFGVKKLVLNSLRYLQDKQFQSLSVSSESWVDIIEVKPGEELKKFLMDKKDQRFKIVAAEQASKSVHLQDFNFPKKTVLLMGHEKEGVPADLLNIIDYCVEIPQRGFVRSLNVHVTASILIWTYNTQHVVNPTGNQNL